MGAAQPRPTQGPRLRCRGAEDRVGRHDMHAGLEAAALMDVQALITAARDGVDVRLLVPRASDIPILKPITRVGYGPLIEAGVRVFEWNGAMLHAKTAVADSYWTRIGSTNLSIASWLTNWELDVTIKDADFARAMADTYLADLANATEI